MSNFYNTTGIDIISMVQEEQTEFNVLTEGFFGSIGDFIRRLWNGVISFIKACYNKIKDFLKRFFSKEEKEESVKDTYKNYSLAVGFKSFTRDSFEKYYKDIERIFKSDLEVYDMIKDKIDDRSFTHSMKILIKSQDGPINNLIAYFDLGSETGLSVYLPDGSLLLASHIGFKKSPEIINGFKEIHEFYVECQKRLLDLVVDYNRKITEIYKWFGPICEDPNIVNRPDMKNIFSTVKKSSTDLANRITHISNTILKWAQNLEKCMIEMREK